MKEFFAKLFSTKFGLLIIIGIIAVILVSVIYYYAGSNKTANSEKNPSTGTQEKSSVAPIESATQKKFNKNVFFIHHSTGEIYWNGGMKNALENAGYQASAPWWDGNTDPPDFYSEFSNKWDLLAPHSIIIFKSCFPASAIDSDEVLKQYKNYYIQLYEIYRVHPDKLFVPMSTPPLLQKNTNAEAAKRALDFEKWLLSEYKNNYDGKNLAPFGLHSLLSDENGYLKDEFIGSSGDDHPNEHSGAVVGEAIVTHLSSYVQ